MIKSILNVKDPILRTKCKSVIKVDKKISELIKDLKDTLKVQKDPEGVGLAAPQIGKNLRVFVIMPEPGKCRAFINAHIVKFEKGKNNMKKNASKKIMEGCLSLPNYYGPLMRSWSITVNYLDEKGEKKNEKFVGLEAQIILHEIDHLEGVLFIDRLLEQKTPLYEYMNGEWEEVDLIY